MSQPEEAPRTPGELQVIQVECGVCKDRLVHDGVRWTHSVPVAPEWPHQPDPKPITP